MLVELMRREELQRAISEQLWELRTKHNLTQHEMADRTGIRQSAIARLESDNAKNLPTLRTLLTVANALGLSLEVKFRKKK